MASPDVGQAALLAIEFKRAIQDAKPQSVGLIGCAGGNGLDALVGTAIAPVVCVDINPGYLASLMARYKDSVSGLETVCCEVEVFSFKQPLDLIFGGLIFEYTRLDEALAAVSFALHPGGRLVALVQVKSSGVATVSASPYAQALAEVAAKLRAELVKTAA